MTVPLFSEPVEGEVLPPAAPETVTEECDEPGCGWVVTGPAGGKNSAPMQLGKHRWSVHKIRKDGTRAAPAKGSTAAESVMIDSAHPVANTVAAIGGKVKGTGAPRAQQLADALGLGLSVVTQGAARWAVGSDPMIQAELGRNPAVASERQDALIAALSLSAEAGAKVLAPIARVIAPTELNRKYGRQVVENTDLGPALMELSDVGRVWFQYLAVRRQSIAALRAANAAAGPAMAPPVTPDAQMAAAAQAAPPPPAHVPVDPTLGAGRIATAAHVPTQQQ